MSDESQGPPAPESTSPESQSPKPPRRSQLGRAIASMRGTAPKSSGRRRSAPRGYRDPMLVGDALEEVLGERGWQQVSALATLQATWPEVVGAELADHLVIESLEEGVLALRADSTAWATQVELMLPVLTQQVRAAVGADAIRSVRVRGPQAPSWGSGSPAGEGPWAPGHIRIVGLWLTPVGPIRPLRATSVAEGPDRRMLLLHRGVSGTTVPSRAE